MSMVRIFRKDLLGITIQCSLLLGAFMFSYYSISFWYPTLLRETGLEPIRYLIALNLGGIIGAAFWGRMSETRLGRRGSATAASLMAIVLIPVYLSVSWPMLAVLAAFLMGAGGAGMWGIIPDVSYRKISNLRARRRTWLFLSRRCRDRIHHSNVDRGAQGSRYDTSGCYGFDHRSFVHDCNRTFVAGSGDARPRIRRG